MQHDLDLERWCDDGGAVYVYTPPPPVSQREYEIANRIFSTRCTIWAIQQDINMLVATNRNGKNSRAIHSLQYAIRSYEAQINQLYKSLR